MLTFLCRAAAAEDASLSRAEPHRDHHHRDHRKKTRRSSFSVRPPPSLHHRCDLKPPPLPDSDVAICLRDPRMQDRECWTRVPLPAYPTLPRTGSTGPHTVGPRCCRTSCAVFGPQLPNKTRACQYLLRARYALKQAVSNTFSFNML